ncbi:hypothetical protein AC578_10159 [Pseudocercospora eumusae]|uniref:C2H2-type domain-containing protein n=1 Tax=Pseudocercospora eumusae TaxID=321146 RepID=A0A139HYU8_9PEZI|nr:hypothetical protein AC578_10159 [Pseudocercospora eumusae]
MEGSRYGSPDIPELASSSSQSTGEQQEFAIYDPPTPPPGFDNHNAYRDSLFTSFPGGNESQGWNEHLQLQDEGQEGIVFAASQGPTEEEECMQLDDLGSEPHDMQESPAPRPRKLRPAPAIFEIDPQLLGSLHDGPINQLMQDPARMPPPPHQHNAFPPLQTCKTCGIDPTLELDAATVGRMPLQLAPPGTRAIARMPTKKPEKKFAFHCEYCGKGTSRKGDLERHERTACPQNPRCKKTLCPSCDFAHCRRDKVLGHCKKFSHEIPT